MVQTQKEKVKQYNTNDGFPNPSDVKAKLERLDNPDNIPTDIKEEVKNLMINGIKKAVNRGHNRVTFGISWQYDNGITPVWCETDKKNTIIEIKDETVNEKRLQNWMVEYLKDVKGYNVETDYKLLVNYVIIIF